MTGDPPVARSSPEEENRNIDKLQTHIDASDGIRTHGANMRVAEGSTLYSLDRTATVFGRHFKHEVKNCSGVNTASQPINSEARDLQTVQSRNYNLCTFVRRCCSFYYRNPPF